MKQVLLLVLVASTINAQAQCLVTDLGLSGPDNAVINDIQFLPDGGMWVTTMPTDGLGETKVLRTDGQGQVIVNERIISTNPALRMAPRRTIVTSDGGALVLGDLHHGYTSNQPTGLLYTYTSGFALKVDAAGATQWGRIYQEMFPRRLEVPGTWTTYQSQPGIAVRELQGGGYAMTFAGYDSSFVITTDAMGVPTQSLRFASTPPWHLASAHAPDGSVFGAYQGYPNDALGMFRMDATGNILWSGSYGSAVAYPLEVLAAANGDHVVLCHRYDTITYDWSEPLLMRIGVNGDLVWARSYAFADPTSPRTISELGNGNILIAGRDLLVLVASDGSVLNAWDPAGGDLVQQVALRNDSICVFTTDGFWPAVPNLIIAPSAATLGNEIPTTALSSSTVLSPTVTTGSTAFVPHPLKSWPMALNDALPTTTDITTVISAGCARPGFQQYFYIPVINQGAGASGPVEVTLEIDALTQVLSAWPAPTSTVGNTLTWSNLPAFPSFGVTALEVLAQLPPNPLLIGQQMTHTVFVQQDSTEASMTNNVYELTETITGAYDPNDKLVRTSSGLNDAEFYPGIDEWLDYTIRFQNTGTDTAFTVVVTDTLPAELSTGSMNILSASHPYTYEFGGDGILRFTFENILLPDSNVNEAQSHGLISFRIEPDDGLPLGTVITNRADIFFDFNPPIRTPDAVVTISMPTTLPELHSDNLLIYPVPVREVLIAQLPEGFGVRRVEVRGSDGRLVRVPNTSPVNNRLDVGMQGLSPGLYVLSVDGAKGQRLTARFVKE